jgi:7,8-dihydroneopterin aldolase/epimerase/oxygenase
MSTIKLVDLEVHYRVGVPDEERAHPQRLLLTVDLGLDFSRASATDRVEDTVDYKAVADELLKFGEGRSWKLLEALAAEIGETLLSKYRVESVFVEIKKFVIPQARHVAVSIEFRRSITP